MKNRFNKFFAGALIAGLSLGTFSCSDILDEQPRSEITPQLMQTNEGVELALVSVYSHLRYIYGPANPFYNFQYGTDETTYGNLVGAGSDEYNMDNYIIQATTGRPGCFWSSSTFAYINTCNGIISIGEANGVDKRLLAEARVMRAHDQFLLVQFHGGIPLDLGSGENEYNVLPNRKSVRNTVEESYAAIIGDLEQAVTDLAGSKRNDRFTGCVTQAYAQYLLSKVYLTYGWWLKNNGKADGGYFQKAYNTALDVINSSGVEGVAGANGFGLMRNYHDVNLAQQDRNMEVLLYADRSDDAGFAFSEGESWGTEAAKSNIAFYAMRPWFDTEFITGSSAPAGRSALQEYGRPWRRVAPTYEVIANTFADKTNDSRYDGTFQKVWAANQNATSSKGANGAAFAIGDTVYYMPGLELAEASAPSTLSGTAKFPVQTISGKNYAVFTPEHMTREHYPALWKIGPYSPANAAGYANSSSLRPYNIAKLSEVYLIAAEAYVMGATGSKSAKELIDVLRARAAYRAENTEEQNSAARTNILAATSSNIDIDYVLDERSRELFGEQLRWADLVRTKKLGRAKSYSICEYNDKAPQARQTTTRAAIANIDSEPTSKFYLRPIPSWFIDALDMTEAEKAAYQNPGY